jgi:hypothetical protein
MKKKNLPCLSALKTHVWIMELAGVKGSLHLIGPKLVLEGRLHDAGFR